MRTITSRRSEEVRKGDFRSSFFTVITGTGYYWISRGIDERPVRANRVRKSVGAENTFSIDLTEFDAMVAELEPLIDKVWRHCESARTRGRTVTLKVKFADFEIITHSRSVPSAVASRDELGHLAIGLLEDNMPLPKAARLLAGISVFPTKRDGRRATTEFLDLSRPILTPGATQSLARAFGCTVA